MSYQGNSNITFDDFKPASTGLINVQVVSFGWYADSINFIDVRAEETEVTY